MIVRFLKPYLPPGRNRASNPGDVEEIETSLALALIRLDIAVPLDPVPNDPDTGYPEPAACCSSWD